MDAQLSETHSTRKLQVGSRGRSEKIRTYNYNQDRITDHRVGHTIHGIEEFLTGTERLDDMIRVLLDESKLEMLLEILDKR